MPVYPDKQNVIMIGNSDRGKTHLSIALGLKTCNRGYSVIFKNVATLSTALCEAKDNYRPGKLERTLAKSDILILDELIYLSLIRHQSELLFKFISDRSERSSTVVTTNLPFSKWTKLFENTTMVVALIDRLTFRSHVLYINRDSRPLKATMQKSSCQSGSKFHERLAHFFIYIYIQISSTKAKTLIYTLSTEF